MTQEGNVPRKEEMPSPVTLIQEQVIACLALPALMREVTKTETDPGLERKHYLLLQMGLLTLVLPVEGWSRAGALSHFSFMKKKG